MEIQALSPEVIQDTTVANAYPIAPEDISATFGSDCIAGNREIVLNQISQSLKLFRAVVADSCSTGHVKLISIPDSVADLVSERLRSRILSVSDEFFAAAANLLVPTPPIHRPNVYTATGAWYDGWETRRHNPKPFDWVLIRLGVSSGRVKGFEVDTAYFNGNQAPEIAVEGCFCQDDDVVVKAAGAGEPGIIWETILEKQACGPNMRHAWALREVTEKAYTHVRLCMFPDGGIARFRLYGHAVPILPQSVDEVFDLAAAVNGGVATRCSDQHFGSKDNLLIPGRGKDMGDGWETKRSRGVHIDWVIVRLGCPGEIERVVIDTAHFRGNFPQKVQLFGAEGNREPDPDDYESWIEILSPQPCGPDTEHEHGQDLLNNTRGTTYRFVKMVIIPDGGVKRLRVFGRRMS